jgi:NAD(P)-dependent dehydrogenase (short-subunit alcohol dehydrogenase family)
MNTLRPLINPLDMTGKTVLITGASSGIGRATAVMQSKLGARVILNGRNEEALQETLSLMSGHDHIVAPFNMDEVDRLCDWVKSLTTAHGQIDGFAHCAGIQITKPIKLFDLEFFDKVMHTNLASAFALTKGFRHKRDPQKQGSIVFVSSLAGIHSLPCNIVYGASKAGLISISTGMAMELLRDNIRVNCVAPALVETSMVERMRDTMTETQYQNMVATYPMGIGKPDDVAHAITFLLSDSAQWINAITIPVDGGCLAS